MELDELIAATGVLPRAMDIALDHPVCNSASNAATRMLAGALASSVEGLCLPLLQPADGREGLQARLARECSEATQTSIGLRKCHVGAMISMANLLRQLEARHGATTHTIRTTPAPTTGEPRCETVFRGLFGQSRISD